MISISAVFKDASTAREAMRALEREGYGHSRVSLGGSTHDNSGTGSIRSLNVDTDTDEHADRVNRAGIPDTDVIAPGPLATGIASSGAGMGAGSGVIMGGFTPAAVRTVDADVHSVDVDNARDLGGANTLGGDHDDLGSGNVTLTLQALDMDDMHRAQDLLNTFNPLRMEETE